MQTSSFSYQVEEHCYSASLRRCFQLLCQAEDHHSLADMVAHIVELPAGQRPLKQTIGVHTEGVQAINQATAPIQQRVLPALGLGMLLDRERSAAI